MIWARSRGHVPREYLDALIRDDVVLRESIADLVRDDLADMTARYLPLACDRSDGRRVAGIVQARLIGEFLHPAIVGIRSGKMRPCSNCSTWRLGARKRRGHDDAAPGRACSAIVISPRPTS